LAALGADDARLERELEYESAVLEPRKPAVLANDGTELQLTDATWALPEYLGKTKYYPNLASHFFSRLQQAGSHSTRLATDFIFHQAIFPRLFSGLLHPIIHIAYGLESGSLEVMAEGFALAAINRPSYTRVFEATGQGKGRDMGEVLKMAYCDARWDAILKKEDSGTQRIKAIEEKGKEVLDGYMTACDFDGGLKLSRTRRGHAP
jgi:hypothetical protein